MQPEYIKPLLATACLAVLWTFEGILPEFQGRRRRLTHYLPNLTLGIMNAAIAGLLFATAALTVTLWAQTNQFGLLHWLHLPPWLAWPLAIVLFDAWQYLWHVMNHKVPILWRFHAVHHADAELDASSAVRFHTGEILLSSMARLAVLPLLGMTIVQLALYELILLPIILFHHSNVAISETWDRRLRWLIVTPRMHWVHHSDYQPETDSNYSSVFSIWDRIFRSFRLRTDPRDLVLGLKQYGPAETRDLRAMIVQPFRRRR